MKTNLVKFLALSSMVLALGACTGQNQGGEQSSSGTDVSSETTSSQEEVAQVVTITELLELDANYNFALEGKLVTIEHLALQGRYANTIIGGTALGTNVTTLRGLQIDCAEFPTFEHGSGWGADISATGRVTNVNGRAVLADADVTVNSERIYNEAGTSYTGGLKISYWPAAAMDRGSFDTYLGRSMSGIMFEAVFQLASLPEVVTTEQGTSFQVVFPGEYADVDDLENMSLITVNVPDGIGQNGVTKFNTFFEGKAVGDFVDLTGLGQYDLVNNGGYGMILESFAAQDCVVPNPLPTVYTQWAQVAAIAQDYYAAELPDLSNEKTFTYKVNTDYVTYSVDQLFSDASFVKVDHDKAVFVEFDLISKPSDVETVFNEAVADLKAAGFEEDASEDGAAILVKYDGETAIAQADVFNQDSYVEVDYMALPLVTDFETFAELKSFYEGRVGKFVSGFATALVDSTTAANNYNLDIENETYNLEEYGDEEYEYVLTFTYDALAETAVADYQALLVAAGFVPKRMSDWSANGLWNATSHEFVLGVYADAEEKTLAIQVLVVNGDALDYVVDIPTSVDLVTAVNTLETAANADILAITGAAASYTCSFMSAFAADANWSGFTVDVSNGQANASVYSKYGLVAIYIVQAYAADGVNVQTAANAVLAKISGFQAATFSLLGASGYFNSTTNEFIRFSLDTASGVFTIQLIILDATSASYVTISSGE